MKMPGTGRLPALGAVLAATAVLRRLVSPVWSVRALVSVRATGLTSSQAAQELLLRWTADAAYLCLAWLWLVLASALASRLPGAAGRCVGALHGLITPALLRRALATTVGVGLLAAPASALAAPGVARTARTAPTALTALTAGGSGSLALPPVALALGWPTPHPPAAGPAQPGLGAAATPGGDTGGGDGPTTGDGDGASTVVVVRPGQSLWSIAAAALPAGAPASLIQQRWLGLWAANRSVIGPDPSLIRPGELLAVPPATGSVDR